MITRNVVLLCMMIFVFTACSVKEQVVEINIPEKKVVEVESIPEIIGEEIKTEKELILKEKKEEFLIDNSEVFNIALIYPSKIVSKYSKAVISTILAYLSYENMNYNFQVIDSKNEDINNMQAAFESARNQGIQNIIALYTPRSLDNFQVIDTTQMKIYFPLIEKSQYTTISKINQIEDNKTQLIKESEYTRLNEINDTKNLDELSNKTVETTSINDNFIFGSISYEEQFKKLLEVESSGKYAMFYQESYLGNKLKTIIENLGVEFDVTKQVKRKRNYFRGLVKDYRLNSSLLFLNTDIVKSSLLLSQLRVYDITPNATISTQINYDPSLISLTQVKDRNNFIVANSIDDIENNLQDDMNMFGVNINYEWVEYSTLVGINYLYNFNENELIKTSIIDNQVIYKPRLFKATDYGFLEIK